MCIFNHITYVDLLNKHLRVDRSLVYGKTAQKRKIILSQILQDRTPFHIFCSKNPEILTRKTRFNRFSIYSIYIFY